MLKQDYYKIVYYIHSAEYFSEDFIERGKKTHKDRAEQMKEFFDTKLGLPITYKITKL